MTTVGGGRRLTKGDLLTFLAAGPTTAYDAAGALGLGEAAAGMALLRLVRQGLARRAVDPHEALYVYEISPKGLARLWYWAAQEAGVEGGELDD